MTDFDATDAIIISATGENVDYTPFGSALVVVKGLFQSPDDATDGGDVDIEALAPQVILTSVDAPAPDHRDLFTIRGVAYTVKRIEQDESALVVFLLLEV